MITLRIDKYGDIGLLSIQLLHISDCNDYCSIIIVDLVPVVRYTYINVYIIMHNICIAS